MAVSIDSKKRNIIECPICFEFLAPPVPTCDNGHATCRTCRNSLDACAICRGNFSNVKNTLLDEMIQSALLLCVNNDVGCKECLPVTRIKSHEKECFYRKVSCFVCNEKDVNLPYLNEHFANKHGDGKYKSYSSVNFYSAVSISVQLNKWLEPKDKDRYYVIYIKDVKIHFLVRLLYRDKNQILHVGVQFLGKKQEKAGKYMFEVKINQGLSNLKEESFFICTGSCIPYNTLINEEAKKNRKIIPLNLKSIFFNNESLPDKFDLILKIKKCVLK